MPRSKTSADKLKGADGKPIEQYTHKGKDRANNPPVGLVTPDTDKETGKKVYSYDPHLDPTLVWAGGAGNTAMWMLDTDYDGRSLFPRQVFFPMSGEKDGWARLAKNLKAEIDPELIQQYHGTVSLPFVAGERRRAAVKIVDERGIESLKLIDLD